MKSAPRKPVPDPQGYWSFRQVLMKKSRDRREDARCLWVIKIVSRHNRK